MRFSEDIYVYEWTDYFDNNCNSFYIGGEVRALIDPGLSRYVPQLLEQMRLDGIDTDGIRYVVNTHSHPDHFEGSSFFAGTDVQIALHAVEVEFLKGPGGYLYSLFGMPKPRVEVNLPLDGQEVVLGGETFRVLLLPGHSPGSIGLYSPSRKAVFSGDVIFAQNVGRTDFPGGDGALLKQSIRTLAELDLEALLPGHMDVIDGAEAVRRNFEIVIRNVFPYI
jgi:glyoxylase-like metal-dependent hydrolase (beta-lactamase superfamily II)